MMLEKKSKTGWGGARAGAGRPLTGGEVRKQRQTRATDAEWEIIKEFCKLLKKEGADKGSVWLEKIKEELHEKE